MYDENFIVNGLLFIYNHDGGYDKDFSEQLKFVKRETIRIPKGRKIFVLGPSDISFLTSVAANILMERGKNNYLIILYANFIIRTWLQNAQIL